MAGPPRKLYFPEPPSAGGKDEFLAVSGNTNIASTRTGFGMAVFLSFSLFVQNKPERFVLVL
jgi:hypothetical protein